LAQHSISSATFAWLQDHTADHTPHTNGRKLFLQNHAEYDVFLFMLPICSLWVLYLPLSLSDFSDVSNQYVFYIRIECIKYMGVYFFLISH